MAIRHALLTLLAGCALAEGPAPDAPDPLATVWRETIHGGDLIVAVPGTGGYDTLGKFVDAAVDPAHPTLAPTLDGRLDINPIAIEQAIAAAQRAGSPTARSSRAR